MGKGEQPEHRVPLKLRVLKRSRKSPIACRGCCCVCPSLPCPMSLPSSYPLPDPCPLSPSSWPLPLSSCPLPPSPCHLPPSSPWPLPAPFHPPLPAPFLPLPGLSLPPATLSLASPFLTANCLNIPTFLRRAGQLLAGCGRVRLCELPAIAAFTRSPSLYARYSSLQCVF